MTRKFAKRWATVFFAILGVLLAIIGVCLALTLLLANYPQLAFILIVGGGIAAASFAITQLENL